MGDLRERVAEALDHEEWCSPDSPCGCFCRDDRQRAADAALAVVAAWLGEQVEVVARVLAIHADYDGCFERLDGTDVEEPLSTDAEDADWWRARSRAAVDALVALVRGEG